MSPKIVNCPHCGKILPKEVLEGTVSAITEKTKCPQCGSQKVWRDGKRQTAQGEVQRYICRDCGYRFSGQ